ncbi:MAG: pinensin family lanthipeptide [Cyclobacteriaceae bacterium]
MKNQKLKLADLKVKSFTTEVEATNQKTVNGGATGDVVLNTLPMCGLISKFYVCNVQVPTNDWAAECGRRGR